MPFLLLIVLTLACLPEVRPDASGWPEPTWIDSSRSLSALLSGLVLTPPVLAAWVLAWRVRLGLAYHPERRATILRRYERGRSLHQFALFAAYAVALCICGWGWLVGQLWHRSDGEPLPLPELLVLFPFLAALVLGWLCFFDAERACYRSEPSSPAADSLADVLLDEGGLPPLLTTRWAYVGYQLRHRLALVCIPLSLLLLQKEALRQLPGLGQEWFLGASLGGAVSLLALLIGMPWLLRLVLGLRSLPDSPLRDRLRAAARRLGFRCSDLLLWNTGNGMANAMVVGLLPWPRYVVFTDRLLNEFSPAEVEAVLGHEIGHVRHLHMPLYLGFLSASMAVFGALLNQYGPLVLSWLGLETASTTGESFWSLRHHPYLSYAPALLGLLAYVFVVFGFLSRRCERQADASSAAGPSPATIRTAPATPRRRR